MLALARSSAWQTEELGRFLDDYMGPMRLAVTTDDGFPLVCSLWYRFDGERIHAATQRDARVAKHLARDPRCAFEIAPDAPPYHGVRGRARAGLVEADADQELGRLVDRYLGDRESAFAGWLLSRAENEVRLVLDLEWLTSWDYRERMTR